MALSVDRSGDGHYPLHLAPTAKAERFIINWDHLQLLDGSVVAVGIPPQRTINSGSAEENFDV